MEISKLGDSVNRVAFGDSSSRLERTVQSVRDSESSRPELNQVMVAQAFNPRTQEAEPGASLNLRTTWTAQRNPFLEKLLKSEFGERTVVKHLALSETDLGLQKGRLQVF